MERMIIQQIRVIGSDSVLQSETLKQVKHSVRDVNSTLTAEGKKLNAALNRLKTEKSDLLKALVCGHANGGGITERMAELETQAATIATRLADIETERHSAQQAALDPQDLSAALNMFDPIWDVLFPIEQARIIELLIRQIEFNGKTQKMTVEFRPTGIKALAEEIDQEAMV